MAESSVQANVDRLLLEQGVYAPAEFLLLAGRLRYADYEAWRCGDAELLEPLLLGNPERIGATLEEAAAYARRLGLQDECAEYRGWGTDSAGRRLRFCEDSTREALYQTHYARPRAAPQMDLFMDGTATALLNGATDALLERREAEVERLLGRLADSDAGHPRLGALERLHEAQTRLTEPVSDVESELSLLQDTIAPIAVELLGRRSRDYLVPLWRRLAAALRDRAFDPAIPDLHRSFVCGEGLDWSGVCDAVESEPNWQVYAQLHLRRALARYFLGERIASLSDWFGLCWRFPQDAADALDEPNLPDATLQSHWRRFQAIEPELAVEDFPSWCLLLEPGLAKRVDASDTYAGPAGDAFAILCELCQSRAGAAAPDEKTLALRASLKASRPDLFEHYMRMMH